MFLINILIFFVICNINPYTCNRIVDGDDVPDSSLPLQKKEEEEDARRRYYSNLKRDEEYTDTDTNTEVSPVRGTPRVAPGNNL